ncbi:unnamed protein product [Mycena citricolor]|uniref:Uncharacterized protein n=1 Tax=Mycena citricolor TaxID=2018698 RepID=A0AAD2K7L8_9AGAR|nr:unnamed protein product [Mycena citricolor]
MSGSFRLEAPRARPPPLNMDRSSFNSSSSILGTSHHPEPLLYNLPQAHTTSPPTSPRSRPTSPRSPKARLTSPTSPTFGRSRTPINGRSAASPNVRNRSATPIGVARGELDQFAEYCRAWYFTQDEACGRLMTQTLANLPSSQRAPYSRLQASIRSAYHRSVNARKTAEFRAHLAATQPGGSLMPHARADPHGNVARKERFERFERFIRTWCTMGMPGPEPFFRSLWAILRLQVVPESIGGAGRNRIQWEFDDAVLRETGGKDFMLESIDVLKGVLGFTELPSSKRVSNNFSSSVSSTVHSRSKSQPLLSQTAPAPNQPIPKRPRAPSDPFLDTPAMSHSLSSSPSSGTSALLVTPTSTDGEDTPFVSDSGVDDPLLSAIDDTDEDEFLRIWTSPDLTNPELVDLVKLFPSFLTRRALPRFPAVEAPKDLEEGREGQILQFGTGNMWVSSLARADGWEGGWWTRFVQWWKQVFC